MAAAVAKKAPGDEGLRALQRKAVELDREELEDLYFRSCEQNIQLKKECRELETRNKQLATKLIRTTESQAKQRVAGLPPSEHQAAHHVSELEAQIEDMTLVVANLEKTVAQQQRKIELLKQLDKDKSKKPKTPYTGVQSKLVPLKSASALAVSRSRGGGAGGRGSMENANAQPRDASALEKALQEHMQQVKELHSSNVALKARLSSLEGELQEQTALCSRSKADVSRAIQELTTLRAENTTLKDQLKEKQIQFRKKGIDEGVEMIKLKRDLQQKTTELTSIEAKFALVANQLEELKAANHKLTQQAISGGGSQSSLHDATMSSQLDVEKLQRSLEEQTILVAEMRAEIATLKQTNQKLVAAAFDGERERLHLAKEKLLADKILELEKANAIFAADAKAAEAKVAAQVEASANLQAQLEQAEIRYSALQKQLSKAEARLMLLSQDASVDLSEVDRALALVKKKSEPSVDAVPSFLLNHDGQQAEESVRELKALRAAYADATAELEKARRLLAMEHSITDEYKAKAAAIERQMVELQAAHDAKRAEDAAQLDSKVARIQKLEAQLKEIAYGTQHIPAFLPSSEPEVDSVPANIVAADSACMELEKGQNLFEIGISKVNFTLEGAHQFASREPSVFLTLDFFEHETFSTPIRKGTRLLFDCVAQYVVNVDEFFLRYLQRGDLTVELHEALNNSFNTLGIGLVRFSSVLTDNGASPGKLMHGVVKIVSSSDPALTIAEAKYWVRYRLTMEHALRAFRDKIKAQALFDRTGEAATPAQGTLAHTAVPNLLTERLSGKHMNTLAVHVHACRGVRSRMANVQPALYVAYTFFKSPDYASRTITGSSDPAFDSRHTVKLYTDSDLHLFLQKQSLSVFVIDDRDPDVGSFAGVAHIPLAVLSRGEVISGEFPLNTEQGQRNGTLQISLQWESPYEVAEEKHVAWNRRSDPKVAVVCEEAALSSNAAASQQPQSSRRSSAAQLASPPKQPAADNAVNDSDNDDDGKGNGVNDESQLVRQGSLDSLSSLGSGGSNILGHDLSTSDDGNSVHHSNHNTSSRSHSSSVQEVVDALPLPVNNRAAESHSNEESFVIDRDPVPAQQQQPASRHSSRHSSRHGSAKASPEKSQQLMPSGKSPQKRNSSSSLAAPILEQSDMDVVALPLNDGARLKHKSNKGVEANAPPVVINVHRLAFDKGAEVLSAKRVQQLFVSYELFGVSGELLESLPVLKPKKARKFADIDFKREFVFSDGPESAVPSIISGPDVAKGLRAVAKYIRRHDTYPLVLEVVSEPLDEDDPNSQCETVGVATIDLAAAWRGGVDVVEKEVDIVEQEGAAAADQGTKRIGSLVVSVSIAAALNCVFGRSS
eukprot:m.141614 g.141614  ORF g.141614 m.141614 type:complete len:1355 (-) comp16699_c1_seq4:189-4253(-)